MIPINNIYQCLQGEGCNTGLPMVMVRLQGCEVGCPWCDTKETWKADKTFQVPTIEQALGQNPNWTMQDEGVIAGYIQEKYAHISWILISGGEPAQYHLDRLCNELRPHKIALETSGTEIIKGNLDWVCVSPKIDMPGGKPILAQPLQIANEIKMVVGKEDDLKKLDNLLANVNLRPDCQICLQPVSQSLKATRLCVDECLKRNWRLSTQVHKYLAID